MFFLDLNIVKMRKKELDTTIKEISDKSGVSMRTINRFLSGENIGYKHVESILMALDLQLNFNFDNKKIA